MVGKKDRQRDGGLASNRDTKEKRNRDGGVGMMGSSGAEAGLRAP